MSCPSVSVVIPAYNSSSLLGAALESVRAQSFQDFEVIVVDDGSTDGTYDVATEVAKGWPALRVIRIEHGGLALARNRAMQEMTGQWIALLDADDLWHSDKLSRCMEHLQANPRISMVYHPVGSVDAEGKPLKAPQRRCRHGWVTEKLFLRNFIHDSSVVFHKRVVEAVGDFDQSLPVCVGREYWLRVSTKFEIGLVNDALGYHRVHDSALSLRDQPQAMRIRTEMLERFYFERGGKDLLRPRPAKRRLAKVRYDAGRVFLAKKEYQLAAEYLRRAIRYCPAFLKTYPYYLAAQSVVLYQRLKKKSMA